MLCCFVLTYIIFVLSCLVFFSCKVFLHVQKNTSVAICKQKITKVCATMQLLVLDFGLTEFDFLLHQDGVRFHPLLITTGNTSPNTAANQNNAQPQHEEIPHRPSQEIFGSGKGWAGLFFYPNTHVVEDRNVT